jgi:hypothetical protein
MGGRFRFFRSAIEMQKLAAAPFGTSSQPYCLQNSLLGLGFPFLVLAALAFVMALMLALAVVLVMALGFAAVLFVMSLGLVLPLALAFPLVAAMARAGVLATFILAVTATGPWVLATFILAFTATGSWVLATVAFATAIMALAAVFTRDSFVRVLCCGSRAAGHGVSWVARYSRLAGCVGSRLGAHKARQRAPGQADQ